ncbi:MAG: insulinase family protein [Phycisphaeraceae bacterium]|nr:insulinase family protein [Phycisphaeraceae bacterium]
MRHIGLMIIGLSLTLIGLTACQSSHTIQAPKGINVSYEILQDRPDRLMVVLPNRMILIAQELHAAPVVSAQVWVNTGSIYEQEHVGAGLSHFLEHLLAGGSTQSNPESLSNEKLGRMGAQTNAATGLDTVRYYIDATSDNTAPVIDLLSDWMQNSLITQTEYERERQVIQREFEHGMGSPDRIFWKLTQQARYTNHPARHPTIGYLDEFLKISRNEIYDFYKRMYVPNNMVFVVAGDIDKQQVMDQLVKLWADVPAKPLPDNLSFPIEKKLTKPRTIQGTAAIKRSRLRLAWPGTRLAGEHDYALDLLGIIMGQGESSRLVQTIREDQQLVTNISAFNLSFNWGEGFFGVNCEIANAQDADAVSKVKAAILAQVAKMLETGITDDEPARAKRQTTAHVAYNGQSAHALANSLASNICGMSDPDYDKHYAQAIKSITKEQVHTAAKAILVNDRLIEVLLSPEKDQPATDVLTRNDLNTDNLLLTEKIDLDNSQRLNKVRQQLASTRQQVAPITVDPIEVITLDNGLRVLIQKSNLVPAVSIQMYSLGGLLADEPGKQGLSNAIDSMLSKGTKTRSAQQIAQQLEDIGASLGSSCGNNTSYIRAMCLSDDLPTVLNLFADVALNPTFPQSQWDKLKPRLLAMIDRQSDSWQGQLQLKFRKTYFGKNHPWASTTAGNKETVETLTVKQMRDGHAQRLSASNSVLAVFGDVDVADVKKMATKLFSPMPAQSQKPWVIPQTSQPKTGVYVYESKQPLAAVQIGLGPGVTRDDPDFPRIAVLSRLISDFPSGWLEAQLRGKGPGLAYAVWAYQVSGMMPGYIAVGFNTQATTAQQALDRTSEILKQAREQPISQKDVDRARASVLTNEVMGKESNSDRAAQAALNLLYGVGLHDSEKFIVAVKAMDATTLQQTANKYLQNPVVVVVSNEPADLKFE